jgi:hypothetical protein
MYPIVHRQDAAMSVVDRLPYVETELNYLVPMAERPRYGEEGRRPVAAPYRMRIYDMRPLGSEIVLDRQGFALIEHRSEIGDFRDADELRRVYYRESERAVVSATGARRAFAFDHVVRRRIPGTGPDAPITQPVMRVHIDRSGGSIGSSFVWRSVRRTRMRRLRELLGKDADELLRGRLQVISFWRPIRGPVRDTPLAVCDARTVAGHDLVPSDIVYEDRVAEVYSVVHNPAHRWYYASEMRTDEALLIKCSDTKLDDCAQSSPHSAFTDPTTPPDATPRESIEVRMVVFYSA